jgi:outer membrane protein
LAFLLGMGLWGAAGQAADDDGKPRSPSRHLSVLVELAEKNSPVIQRAKNDAEIAELELKNAKWAMFPQLNLESKLGLIGEDPNSRATPWFSELNLSLRQVFWDEDNNSNLSRYKREKRKWERVKLDSEYKRDEQILKVVHAYFDWSSSLELREIDENKRDLLRRQFNVLEAQYKQGLKTKRDVLRIETEIKRLEIDILRRDNEVDLNFQKVASHVGLTKKDLDAEDIEGEEAKPFGVLKGEATEIKLTDHRKSKIFALREEEARYETQLFERKIWPRLTLENEIKYNNNAYVDTNVPVGGNDRLTWQSMLILRYPLWDFGTKKREWEIARVKERSIRAEDQQWLLELAVELRDVFLKLRENRENVRATRELLVLEQQSYSILEAEYRNGRAAYLDLITNLNSLIDARSKFMTSYFGFKKQQMLYSFHKGELYEDLKSQ